MFTWVPFYRELAGAVLQRRDDQAQLIQVLRDIKAQEDAKGARFPMISLNDKDTQDNLVPLSGIDPFTFFSSFNRGIANDNRKIICEHLKKRFTLTAEVPDDFMGIPTAHAINSWFFAFIKDGRKPDAIDLLWNIAEISYNGGPENLNEPLFSQCVSVAGRVMLSMGLFWINPQQYLALDKRILAYAKDNGVKLPSKTLESYQEFVQGMREKFSIEHPQISFDAWRHATDQSETVKKYWAGGHFWGDGGAQKERFLKNNEWQMGFKPEENDKNAQRCRQLFAQIQVGDEFAIKGAGGGRITIHYIGRVKHIDKGNNLLKLDRLERRLYQGKIPEGKDYSVWPTTLLQVTQPEVIELIFNQLEDENDEESAKHIKKIEFTLPPQASPLNQILYGPPGTGKTFSTIQRAVQIIEPDFAGDFKVRFDELMDEGRIAFVTFHQSFSYEDFIEGIRPSLEGDGTARYELRDGVLKEIALHALSDCLETARPGESTFDDLWDAFVEKVESDPNWLLPGLSTSQYKISFTAKGNVIGDNVKGHAQQPYNASREKVEMVWEKLRNSQQKATHNVLMQIIGKGTHTNLIGAIVEELKSLKPNAPRSTSEKPSPEAVITFLKGSKEYRLKSELSQAPRYVLVIDEINRGNISKILGELITLLEDDKRLPGENSLKVTLPYSGEKFALPANLHILGTMNTADKSLALVDVALRRRFVFKELAPDFSVCTELSNDGRTVLDELNNRITLRKDREHRIGHAYFVNLENKGGFDEVFRYRVIPLLQEYFFNDWDGLRFVLGESGKGRFVRELVNKTGAREARNRWQWWFDENPAAKGDCLSWLLANYRQSTAQQSEETLEAADA
ncbi:MAG TPA: AAA family ATPase [Abditibacteriaceae bacterium]|jgi:5-methylcytosine-specific restriction protein B